MRSAGIGVGEAVGGRPQRWVVVGVCVIIAAVMWVPRAAAVTFSSPRPGSAA